MMKKGKRSKKVNHSKSRFAPREYQDETMIPRLNINNKSFSSRNSVPMANSPSSNIRREDSNIRREDSNIRRDDSNIRREDSNIRGREISKSFSGPRRTTIIRTVDPRSSPRTSGSNSNFRRHFTVKASNFNDFNYSSNLTRFELHRLAKRFAKLDTDNSGSLSIEEFMNLTELKNNHLSQRVISLFDQDKNGEVDFREFIDGISVFSVQSERETKLKFAFRIYDLDNDGYISNTDLFKVLQIMVGNNLKDNQLQEIVDRTILYADADEDGKLSFKEFCNSIGNASDLDKTILDIVVDV